MELKEIILQYAFDQGNISIENIYEKIKISPGMLKGLCSADSELAEAVSLALSIIGARREALALQGKLSETMVLKTMHVYNENYDSSVKNDEQRKQAVFNIVVPPIPVTPVPPAPVYDLSDSLAAESNVVTTKEE